MFGFGLLELMLIFVIILVNAAFVVGVIALVRFFAGKSRPTDALSIAKTRYAKGEITAAQFDEIKRKLS